MKRIALFTILTCALIASAHSVAPDYNKGFTDEDVKKLPKIEPGTLTGKLLYECNFESDDVLKDWKLEGPGVVKIEKGKMSMTSACQPALLEHWRKVAAKRPNQELSLDEYFEFVTKLFGPKHPDMIDSKKRFAGGHIVNWATKSETPADYYVEYEVTPLSPIGLYIVFVSAHADDGKSIFDPSLKKRNGVFQGYIKGDIHSYHFSYFANWRGNHRGTCNMRKNSGFAKTASGPDTTFVKPNRTYKIGILKQANRIRFCIDDRVVIDYTDDGSKAGPAHDGGLVGLRQMIDADGLYDNFRVYALK